jgi:hypothetical protein
MEVKFMSVVNQAVATSRATNRMTALLDKIERRLGLSVMTLPEKINKDTWHVIIEEDTIPTFSRYFPYKITTIIDNTCEKDGYFFIDKNLPEGTKIIGVKDVDWQSYRCDPRFDRYGVNFATYDFISREYCLDDVAFTQVAADFTSLFNLGIYIDFLYPNKIRLVSVNGSPVSRYRPFPLEVFIEHPANLMTISPTMMETFERLAQADVAGFLYQQLKYYDGTDTAFINIDLKLDALQEWYNRREDIVKDLDEAHTTTANENQPCIITV